MSAMPERKWPKRIDVPGHAAMTLDEADALQEEVNRRWNAYPKLVEAFKDAV